MYAKSVCGLALAGLVPVLHAFSPVGPAAGVSWQTTANGYQQAGDVVSPRPLQECYRWSSPVVCYRINESVSAYWGPRGVQAIRDAVQVMNVLPAASSLVVTNYPLDAKRINYSAQAKGLLDVKTVTLWSILETVGVGDSIRWTWAIRDHTDVNNVLASASVIHRNYDPVTLQPSSYVNGTLYTYEIVHTANPHVADAKEVQRVPSQRNNTPLAAEETLIGIGEFAGRLTRDDVGALKYMYEPRFDRKRKETLTTDVAIGGSGDGQWYVPFDIGGTNYITYWDPFMARQVTNAVMTTGWRVGVDKLQFQEYNDSLGASNTFQYVDSVWNDSGIKTTQNVIRRVAQTAADIEFQVGDVGFTGNDKPIIVLRVDNPTRFVNYMAINSGAFTEGPGIIHGPIQITFNSLLPSLWNGGSRYLNEFNARIVESWGVFDGSTNVPVYFDNSGTSWPIY